MAGKRERGREGERGRGREGRGEGGKEWEGGGGIGAEAGRERRAGAMRPSPPLRVGPPGPQHLAGGAPGPLPVLTPPTPCHAAGTLGGRAPGGWVVTVQTWSGRSSLNFRSQRKPRGSLPGFPAPVLTPPTHTRGGGALGPFWKEREQSGSPRAWEEGDVRDPGTGSCATCACCSCPPPTPTPGQHVCLPGPCVCRLWPSSRLCSLPEWAQSGRVPH